MRGVAYALTASVALVFGGLNSASAACYGQCNGYQDNRGPAYERYSERPGYREPAYSQTPAYDEGPRYHTTYYERGPEYQTGYYERPAYRTSTYDDGYDRGYSGGYNGGYYDRPYRRYSDYSYDRPYYNGYSGYGHRGYGYGGYGYGYRDYPAVRVGGAWSQTGPAFASHYGGGWGGCRTAYIPYGWTWYRGTSC